MPENAADNLLTGLAMAIADGDALRARRRLGELNVVLERVPAERLAPIRERLRGLMGEARRLKTDLENALGDRPRQRRSVDAYRRMAGQR